MDESPPQIMEWTHGRPCTVCGKPTVNRHHEFEGGGRSWAYYAPLYHNPGRQVAFCSARCSWEWALEIVYHNMGNR